MQYKAHNLPNPKREIKAMLGLSWFYSYFMLSFMTTGYGETDHSVGAVLKI